MVIATNPDGLESKRKKWSRAVRGLFMASERASTWFSHAIVCDSEAIESYYKKTHKPRRTFVAEYGALENPFLTHRSGDLGQILKRDEVGPRAYHLVVARIEPENQIREIVEGFRSAAPHLHLPLLIVGDCTANRYGRDLMGGAPPSVSFLGSVYDGERLDALRAGACSYVHGHTVGGTNPSLLEAMASASLCICHDNVFNRSTTGEQALFFKGPQDLGAHLVTAESQAIPLERMRAAVKIRWQENYTWKLIAGKYAAIFRTLLKGKAGGP
jgi:glycosyltransferase involved in cell wall biosynthesis